MRNETQETESSGGKIRRVVRVALAKRRGDRDFEEPRGRTRARNHCGVAPAADVQPRSDGGGLYRNANPTESSRFGGVCRILTGEATCRSAQRPPGPAVPPPGVVPDPVPVPPPAPVPPLPEPVPVPAPVPPLPEPLVPLVPVPSLVPVPDPVLPLVPVPDPVPDPVAPLVPEVPLEPLPVPVPIPPDPAPAPVPVPIPPVPAPVPVPVPVPVPLVSIPALSSEQPTTSGRPKEATTNAPRSKTLIDIVMPFIASRVAEPLKDSRGGRNTRSNTSSLSAKERREKEAQAARFLDPRY